MTTTENDMAAINKETNYGTRWLCALKDISSTRHLEDRTCQRMKLPEDLRRYLEQ